MSSKPTKPTTQKKREAIIGSLMNGCTITDACAAANCDRSTYYDWYTQNKGFAEKVDAAKESRIQRVEDALYNSAIKGNVTAQIYFLQNRASDKWQDKRNVDVSAKDGIQLIIGKTLKDV